MNSWAASLSKASWQKMGASVPEHTVPTVGAPVWASQELNACLSRSVRRLKKRRTNAGKRWLLPVRLGAASYAGNG